MVLTTITIKQPQYFLRIMNDTGHMDFFTLQHPNVETDIMTDDGEITASGEWSESVMQGI